MAMPQIPAGAGLLTPWDVTGRLLLASWTCFALAACQVASVRSPIATDLGADTGSATTPHAIILPIRGRVDWPAHFLAQASSTYASNDATLTLFDSNNNAVVSGLTSSTGTFALPLGTFTPAAGTYYLLEATHGLNNNAPGNQVARFRTYLEWTGTAWTSTSGTTIAINAQTTACALVSGLDTANAPSSATIADVNGTLINGPIGPYSASYLTSMANAILTYLSSNTDGVQATTATSSAVLQ
ncbi:MAG: hypothetical protein KGR26_14695, partial [Cyanobacteria bacterium REEB65]|nr:hypothetical protein [Cyanobacteria bacterium REEB65]